jgi:hypothetical protein
MTTGRVLAVLVAAGLATFAFVYRFNALGGSLGGLHNDDFFVITRADMVLDGQRPLRDFVDAELRGAWPSLSYAVPAWAQMLWGRNLLVIVSLSLGVLSLCAGIGFLLARGLSQRWLVALPAGAAIVVSGASLYNHPKVLALTVGAAAIRWALSKPTWVQLAVLAVWTVIAGLYRHDYGVYVGVATVTGLIAREPRPWRVPAKLVAIYVGCGLLFTLPSIVWVAQDWGLARYLEQALLAPGTEGLRLREWPTVRLSAPLDRDSLNAFNYYVFWAMPLAGLGVLALRPYAGSDRETSMRGMGVALVAMTLLVEYFFLRSNLGGRLGDATVPVVLLAAWIAGAADTVRLRSVRLLGRGLPVVLALIFAAFFLENSVLRQLHTGGIAESADAAKQRFDYVKRTLRSLPPETWAGQDLGGAFGAARYIAECTSPDDHVLVGAYAYEIPYFARRRFAGGQGLFSHGFFRDERYQRLVLERLARQSVPIVLTEHDYQVFATDYPLVARYVSDRYRDAGVIDIRGEPYVRVFVEKARHPHRTDPILGLPCFR